MYQVIMQIFQEIKIHGESINKKKNGANFYQSKGDLPSQC